MNRVPTLHLRWLRALPLATAVAALAVSAALPFGSFQMADAAVRVQKAQPADDGMPAQDAALAAAAASLRAGRFADAYGRYAECADRGDESAAWMALAMVANGPALFRSEWSATPGQLSRWNALANRRAARVLRTIADYDRGE